MRFFDFRFRGPVQTRAPISGWHASNRKLISIDSNSGSIVSAKVHLTAASDPIYLTLSGNPKFFSKIPEGAGIRLTAGDMALLEVDATREGDASFVLMILEFDRQGNRIGTKRTKSGQHLLYTPTAQVARILPCIRCIGTGALDFKSIAFYSGSDLPGHLAARALAADTNADMARCDAKLAQVGKNLGPIVLWPASSRKFCFMDVAAGDYELEISHEDSWIARARKSLIARFGITNERMDPELAARMGLSFSESGHAFSYMGGQKRRSDGYAQNILFKVPDSQTALVVELQLPAERLLNINSFKLKKHGQNHLSRQQLEDRIALRIKEWISKTPRCEDVKFLLYADININVVDGSSIWLSSMASLLCNLGKCLLVAKCNVESDIILSNIDHAENLVLVTPEDLGFQHTEFRPEEAIIALRCLDDMIETVQRVVMRGSHASECLLETRQFRNRAWIYLTDFYSISSGAFEVPPDRQRQVRIVTKHAETILVQTKQIEKSLGKIAGRDFKSFELPPIVPEIDLTPSARPGSGQDRPVRIGYAGKINPHWGVNELLDWCLRLKERNIVVSVDIVANKISNRIGSIEIPGFRDEIIRKMELLGARHHTNLNRAQSMQLMAEMDYVWCWRPPELEDNTLELSTKLVEMAANNARCICYPSSINKDTLGNDYPFFARDEEGLVRIIGENRAAPVNVAKRIKKRHSPLGVLPALKSAGLEPVPSRQRPRLCFSGHDFKFIDPYISHLKAQGYPVRRDIWDWGGPRDLDRSGADAQWADVIFCEWGLANAVWHAQHADPKKRIFVRCHLQEINERARKFGYKIDPDRVDKFIFVSERVRDKAMELFGWPESKTAHIANFVLTDEFNVIKRPTDNVIRLGMVGIVPQRKRFDRAIDLLIALREKGHEAELHIKGPRPETLEFMHAPGRAEELDYYNDLYKTVSENPLIQDRVIHYDWGNDVADWYGNIGYILSCSDFESFHYALADGVLTGCLPLVWPWDEAEKLYTPDWIVRDTAEAVLKIEQMHGLDAEARGDLVRVNRELVSTRYGHETIFRELDSLLTPYP